MNWMRKFSEICRGLEEAVIAALLLIMVVLTAWDIVRVALWLHGIPTTAWASERETSATCQDGIGPKPRPEAPWPRVTQTVVHDNWSARRLTFRTTHCDFPKPFPHVAG